jgi:hypothetical protein
MPGLRHRWSMKGTTFALDIRVPQDILIVFPYLAHLNVEFKPRAIIHTYFINLNDIVLATCYWSTLLSIDNPREYNKATEAYHCRGITRRWHSSQIRPLPLSMATAKGRCQGYLELLRSGNLAFRSPEKVFETTVNNQVINSSMLWHIPWPITSLGSQSLAL